MIEVFGNLWTYPADIRVITTNGAVNSRGQAVMGRGCAADARIRYPGADILLGAKIVQLGNKVHILKDPEPPDNTWLVTFPVKRHWKDMADKALIVSSCVQLLDTVAELEAKEDRDLLEVVMPRPGCGFGGLKWDMVKVILDHWLDDRFRVITWSSSGRPGVG